MLVVINGPVAIAGSIPLLFKNKGINVPIIPATIITATKDKDIARATSISLRHKKMKPNKKIANIIPFKIDNKVSLNNLLLILL